MSSLDVATDWRLMFALLCVAPLFAAYAGWMYLDSRDISNRKIEKAFRKSFLRHRNSSFATAIAVLILPGDKGKLGILTLFSDSLIFEALDGTETRLSYADIRSRSFSASIDGQPPAESTRFLRLETATSTISFAIRPESERQVSNVLEYASVGNPRSVGSPPPAEAPAAPPPRALPPLPPLSQK